MFVILFRNLKLPSFSLFSCSYCFQVELYNSMVEKEGTEDEEEAKKAYKAAREHSDHTAQKAIGDKVSSALIDRVIISIDSSVKTLF